MKIYYNSIYHGDKPYEYWGNVGKKYDYIKEYNPKQLYEVSINWSKTTKYCCDDMKNWLFDVANGFSRLDVHFQIYRMCLVIRDGMQTKIFLRHCPDCGEKFEYIESKKSKYKKVKHINTTIDYIVK